jgi:hypothetical protein
LHVIQELSLLLENVVSSCNSSTVKYVLMMSASQNEHVHGLSQDSGVLEEERRWHNLLAQSPSKGEFEFEGADVML